MTVTAPLGGNFLNSFGHTMLFVPWAGATTFTVYASQSSGTLFDIVRCSDIRTRHLDNSTTTGLWFHTGRRQTALDGTINATLKYNADTPFDQVFNYATNLKGYQLYITLGTSPTTLGRSSAYYWLPSVFVNVGGTKADVSSDPPKLIELDVHIEPNGPMFYIDGTASDDYDSNDSGHPVALFLSYLTTYRATWGF